MKSQFWKADWFLGVVIAVAMLAFNATSNVIPGEDTNRFICF